MVRNKLHINILMKKSIVFAFLSIASLTLQTSNSNAQSISMEATLNYVNDKLGPDIKVEVARGYIIAKYYESGELYREDKASCKTLDISEIGYDKENRIMYVNCEGNALCVDRTLYQRKIRREYVRLSFPVTLDERSANGMKNAMTHMIRLVNERKYESNEPFEK